MGSVPSPQKVEIDLNGTGAFVDVSSFVDQNTGVTHTWGRTDWTSAEPQPGSIRFSLENLDGRFTPGNTAVYTTGCIVGTLVQWTCGTRVRRFRMGVPSLSFPGGVSGLSYVAVEAFDALQLMAQKKMGTLLDETVLGRSPVAYWLFDEAAANPVTATVAVDSSGNNEANQVPWGNADGSAFAWQGGNGPSQDGRSCLYMKPGGGWAGTQATLGSSYDWTNKSSGGTGYNVWGASMWVKIDNDYGAVNMGAASSAGPFIHLITVGSTEIFWDAPHRGIMAHDATAGTSTSYSSQYGSTVPIDTAVTTHLAFVLSTKLSATYSTQLSIWVNGVYMGVISLGTTAPATMPGIVRMGGHLGTPSAAIGACTAFYGFDGTRCDVSIHLPPSVGFTTTRVWTTPVTDMYPAGMGASETSSARFTRLCATLALSHPEIAFAPQGAPKSFLLSNQATAGKSLLTATCQALRGDDAGLDTIVTGGVETVRAWLYGSQHALTPVVTVDVDLDCVGVPELTFDASGVAVNVTAKNETTSTAVTFRDFTADLRWQGTSTDVACVLSSPTDMLELANTRAALGRVTQVTPRTVTVDAVTSENDLTAALLALRPWVTVAVSGFPDAIVGYGAVNCYLSGVTERHRLGASEFQLMLLPSLMFTSDTTTDPLGSPDPEGPWRLSDFPAGNYAVSGNAPPTPTTLSSGATTIYLYTNQSPLTIPFLSTVAGDYPLDIMVDGEVIHCPNAASAATFVSGTLYYQSLTGVTRGYTGGVPSAAAFAHAYSFGQSLSIVNIATGSPHYDPYIMR